MNKDLSIGNPRKVLWLYSLPLLASIIFQQLYNIADSLVAGKYLGENALAAVGNASEITLIYTAFAFGCNMGCCVVISQLFGAKKITELKTSVWTAFIAFGVMCVLLMLAGFLFIDSALRLIQTPDTILGDSSLYLDIYTWGMPFVFFYNIATGIFSALGDSKTPFLFLAFSSLSNIGADILFVTAFDMGVAGVAYATLICQGISCVLSLVTLFFRLKKMKSEARPKIFSFKLLIQTLRIAIPSILQQGSISFGNVMIQAVVNGFGESVIAGFTAASKLNSIAVSCLSAVSNGLSTFTAQNIGAQRYDRVKPGYRAGLLLDFILYVPLVLLYTIFGCQLIGAFMSEPSEDALQAGALFLLIVSPAYIICGLKVISDGVIRGAGAINYFLLDTFADLLLRVLFSFILSRIWGPTGIWLSWPIGWAVGGIIAVFVYRKGLWRRNML